MITTQTAAQWGTLTLMACFLISETGWIKRTFWYWLKSKPKPQDYSIVVTTLTQKILKLELRIRELETELTMRKKVWDTTKPMDTIPKGGGDE